MTDLIGVLLGIALLVAGRRLFWLFVGALGFIAGLQLASLLPQLSETAILVTGLIFGVIFALLAIFLQRLAVGLAGFLAGGFILTTLMARLGLEGLSNWVIYIIGGILGVILVMLLFDWALIVFSSIAGAALILQAFSTQTVAGGIIFFLMALAGVIIQAFLPRWGIRRKK